MSKGDNQVYRIDFTLSLNTRHEEYDRSMSVIEFRDRVNNLADELKTAFYHISENYVFQLELTGEENYHFQGRINLKKKKRTREFENLIKDNFGDDIFYFVNASPTNVHCTTFSYVMKPETRILGPWANRPLFLGRSILQEKDLKPWHRRFIQMLEDYDDDPIEYRKLINITDTRGGQGKSSLVRYLQHYYANDVSYVDIWGTLAQISNSVSNEGARKMYLIDLPKSFNSSSTKLSGDKVEQLASLLERIKDGGPIKGTMRGGCQTLLFDPPITVLFSNWAVKNDFFTPGRLVTLNLADLYFEPSKPNSYILEYNQLNSNWKWFYKDSETFDKVHASDRQHDNGVH